MTARKKRAKRAAAGAALLSVVAPPVMRWLRRKGAARRGVDLRMTVIVERPIADVFDFCRDFENFPRFVDMLLSVEDTQDGRSHWAVRSPSGHVIEWDAAVTKYVPHTVIAWESLPGSEVKAGGTMRFAPLSPAETRVDMSLVYRPNHTALNDAVRALIAPSTTLKLRSELANLTNQIPSRTPV